MNRPIWSTTLVEVFVATRGLCDMLCSLLQANIAIAQAHAKQAYCLTYFKL